MKKFQIYVFFVLVCSVYSNYPDFELLIKNNASNTLIVVLPLNTTYCPMFGRTCKIPMYVGDTINIDDISHYASRNDYFKFVRIESCVDKECLNLNSTLNFSLNFILIDSVIVGKGNFQIKILQNDSKELIIEHNVVVTSPERIEDKIHQIYVIVFQMIISVFMGLLLDLKTIYKIIKMPIPVLIGFFLQYLAMPLLAFSIVKLFSFSPIDAFALFIYGCCPGGSASNNWTIMFNGDIDLSVIMTFVSTMASLILMPAWIYSLGRVFTQATSIYIPFLKLIMNLFTTIGPCLLGLSIVRCFPKLRPIVLKIAKPITLFTLLSFLALTLYVKYYTFLLLKWQLWILPPLVPWIGFLLSAFVAKLARLPTPQIYTIAIETGIQNVGIAFLIVLYNFPSPESDYAILPIITVSFLTNMPLWFLLLIITIKTKLIDRCLKKKKNSNIKELNGDEITSDETIDLNRKEPLPE